VLRYKNEKRVKCALKLCDAGKEVAARKVVAWSWCALLREWLFVRCSNWDSRTREGFENTEHHHEILQMLGGFTNRKDATSSSLEKCDKKEKELIMI
jgi:hypothetical protein